MKIRNARLLGAGAVAIIALGSTTAFGATAAKRYAVPISTEYETTALLTVGDEVPWTKDATKSYQMVGIPDGDRKSVV